MIKFFGISIFLLAGLQARADIFLTQGESIRIGGNRIFCGLQQSEDSYYCTIESSFDGIFSGEGNTQLEAEYNAKQSCKHGSRQNGFFCKNETLTCQSNN